MGSLLRFRIFVAINAPLCSRMSNRTGVCFNKTKGSSLEMTSDFANRNRFWISKFRFSIPANASTTPHCAETLYFAIIPSTFPTRLGLMQYICTVRCLLASNLLSLTVIFALLWQLVYDAPVALNFGEETEFRIEPNPIDEPPSRNVCYFIPTK